MKTITIFESQSITVMKYSIEQLQTIADNMIQYGGSFHSLLGRMILKADKENTDKLISVFSKDFERYLNLKN